MVANTFSTMILRASFHPTLLLFTLQGQDCERNFSGGLSPQGHNPPLVKADAHHETTNGVSPHT
jgi:hypothetical protein